MRLLVVRHAIAEDREAFAATGRDDSLRPLTPGGARKMRRAARGLHTIVPSIDALASSPFTRAVETAKILQKEYGLDAIEKVRVLEPDEPVETVVGSLGTLTGDVICLVGHEPQLGRLLTFLIAGQDRSAVELKKGAACLLEFEGPPGAAGAKLIWSIPPGVLRDLAR